MDFMKTLDQCEVYVIIFPVSKHCSDICKYGKNCKIFICCETILIEAEFCT